MKHQVVLFLLIFSCCSCAKKKAEKQAADDEKVIVKYINDHNLSAKATGSGLYYVVNTPGTGANPTINSSVTVNYKGYLTTGTVFDESASVGITFGLNGVIKGWQEGIPYFKKGGKGILLVPSALGYGSQTNGKISANSVLIFDVELLNIK